MSSKSIGLQIVIDSKSHEKILLTGEKILLGRDPECFVVLADDTSSSRHLEIEWDGKLIWFRDLESSNGSFRMPQDSPFVEISLDPLKASDLHLRLAQSPVDISWIVIDIPIAPSESKPELKKQIIESPIRLNVEAATKEVLGPVSSSLLIGGFVFFILTLVFYFKYFQEFFTGSWSRMKLGQALDVYLLWFDEVVYFVAIFVIAVLVFYVLRRIKFVAQFWGQLLLAKTLIVVFWLAPFLVPLSALYLSGDAVNIVKNSIQYRNLQSKIKNHDFTDKDKNLVFSTQMNHLTEAFKGSSIYYSFWYNFQKKRVINECGGIGAESWAKKRYCLTLLFALSLESFTKIRPVYLNNTASHLVLLNSLDGVVRVLAAEGPDSEHLNIFVSSLTEVGLEEEASAFAELVKSFRGQNFADMMKSLFELRLRLEEKVTQLQSQKNLPEQLSLNLIGPLEMGI